MAGQLYKMTMVVIIYKVAQKCSYSTMHTTKKCLEAKKIILKLLEAKMDSALV